MAAPEQILRLASDTRIPIRDKVWDDVRRLISRRAAWHEQARRSARLLRAAKKAKEARLKEAKAGIKKPTEREIQPTPEQLEEAMQLDREIGGYFTEKEFRDNPRLVRAFMFASDRLDNLEDWRICFKWNLPESEVEFWLQRLSKLINARRAQAAVSQYLKEKSWPSPLNKS